MSVYGLPYHDVPGIGTVEDLKDPEKARAMGAAMARRMGRGDAVPNLAVVSLVTNAWLLTGEDRYRAWVLDYAGRWAERARANGGLLPDNVGLSGRWGSRWTASGTAPSTAGPGPTGSTTCSRPPCWPPEPPCS